MNQTLTPDIHAVANEVRKSGLAAASLCTIQTPSGTFNQAGAPDGNYDDLTDHVNLPCRAAPTSDARVQATEIKALAEIMSKNLLHVYLSFDPATQSGRVNAYYPLIRSGYRAVIDGVNYEILGAEDDGNQQQTRLSVQLASI